MLQTLLDDERLAEDARSLCQRHGHVPLQRGAMGKLRVVIRVTEFVRSRLSGVDTATPVEKDQ